MAGVLLSKFRSCGASRLVTSWQDNQKAEGSTEDASGPAATFSVKVKVVNVIAVTVRDKHGKIVNNLNKDDFSLTEDGRPQSIHYFSRETDLPLTLGLLSTLALASDACSIRNAMPATAFRIR
jgi:hypothetical protein